MKIKKFIKKLVYRAAARRHYADAMEHRRIWFIVYRERVKDALDGGFTDEAIQEQLDAVDTIGFYQKDALRYAWILGTDVLRRPTIFDRIILRLFPQYLNRSFWV